MPNVSRWTAAVCVSICISCQGPPPPPELQPPELQATVSHFRGSALSGPQLERKEAPQLEDALRVVAELFAFERLPLDVLLPLEEEVQLVSVSRGGIPILPAARLTRDARIGAFDSPADLLSLLEKSGGRWQRLKHLEAALPKKVTARFLIRPNADESSSADDRAAVSSDGAVEIQVTRSSAEVDGDTVRVALFLDGFASLEPDELPEIEPDAATTSNGSNGSQAAAAGSSAANEIVRQREQVLFHARPVAKAARTAIALPSPFAVGNAAGLVVLLRVDTPQDLDELARTQHVRVVAQCADDLEREARDAARKAAAPSPAASEWSAMTNVLGELPRARDLRPSLLYLAVHSGAPLGQDVILAADVLTLKELWQQIDAQRQKTPPADIGSLAWLLESGAASVLAQRLQADRMAPNLESIILRHAGEVGRDASTLAEVVARSRSVEEFYHRLREENLVFLEDNSPAARLRAFDWLDDRDAAPPGYDPLADTKKRRAALARAASDAQAAGAGAPK